MEAMISNNNIAATQGPKREKDWPTLALVMITMLEIFVYLLFYVMQYFAKQGDYISGTFISFGNIPHTITFMLRALLVQTSSYFVGLKAVLIFKNLYSKNAIKTSLSSGFITLLNPAIVSSAYIFLHTLYNIFIIKKAGTSITANNTKVLFFAPIPFLIAIWLFYSNRRKEKGQVTLPSLEEKSSRSWIFAVITTLVLVIIVSAVQSGLVSLRTKTISQSSTQENLELLGAKEGQEIQLNIIKITANGLRAATLEWGTSLSPVKEGDRILVIFSGPGLSYKNPYGEEIVSKMRSSCTVFKTASGYYSCSIELGDVPPQGGLGEKRNYKFYIGESNEAAGRDEKRKNDLKKLQTAFAEYLKANGSYPCDCGEGPNRRQVIFKGKELPQFDWGPYKDPRFPRYHYAITTSALNDRVPPSYVAAAEMEIVTTPYESSEFFCVDSSGNQKVIARRPKIIFETAEGKWVSNLPYSCDKIQNGSP